MFYKRRDYSKIVNGRNPIVAHEFLGSSVEGKDVFIIDDMISSGESMLDVARELKKRKAKRVFLASTFGLFLRHGGLHHARSHSKRVAAPDVTNADLSDARPAASWREAGSTGSACFRERGVIMTPAPFFRSQAVA